MKNKKELEVTLVSQMMKIFGTPFAAEYSEILKAILANYLVDGNLGVLQAAVDVSEIFELKVNLHKQKELVI